MSKQKPITVKWNEEELKSLEKAIKYQQIKGTFGDRSKTIKQSVKLYADNVEMLLRDFMSRYSSGQRAVIKKAFETGAI